MITADDAIKALREVVAERGPEYVYVAPGLRDPVEKDDFGYPLNDECRYVEADGTPSCGVGVVVFKLDPEAFRGLVNFEGNAPFMLVDEGVISAEPGAVEVLTEFQSHQDVGDTYATSLSAAEAVYDAL